MKYYIPLLSLLLTSCISINGDFKGLYSYYNQTKKDYPQLLVKPPAGTSLCAIPKTEIPKVIVVNGKDIKACMQSYENAVLYIMAPKCHGIYCYSPTVLQRKCNERGIELFIVSEYYDGETMTRDYTLNRQIFGIDIDYYHASLVDAYIPKFIEDITDIKERNIKFIQFKDGHFKRMFKDLKDL